MSLTHYHAYGTVASVMRYAIEAFDSSEPPVLPSDKASGILMVTNEMPDTKGTEYTSPWWRVAVGSLEGGATEVGWVHAADLRRLSSL